MSEINHSEHVDPDEAAAAHDPAIGTGTPETAPHEPPPTTRVERQPVAVIGAVQALVACVTLIVPLGVPVWAAILVVVVLFAVGDGLKWTKVTPVAAPRLNEDLPLTPPGA